jgi:carboxylesterase
LDLKKIKWQEYTEASYTEFEKLKSEYDTVSVSGLCLGAVLALAIGIKYGDQVHAICPISTTLNFDGWGLPFFTKLIWLAPFTPFYHFYNLSECDPYGIKDEKLRNFIKKKMSDTSKTHYAKVPFKSIWEMRKLNFYVKKNMHKITSEICAIHPLEDDVSSIKSVEDIKKRVSSQRFESLILKDSYHLATIDRERDLVANTICNFIGSKHILGMG